MRDYAIPACPVWYQPLLIPVSEDSPCGANLEDDAAFLLLESRLTPKMGAEYGHFVEAVDPVNWAEIERDVKTLLTRSLDLRLVVILIRCRLRRIGVAALDEGLCAIIWMLNQWPEQVHPQCYDEGMFEPIMRANALAELSSHEGILADLRQQPLPKVTGLQLSVRDVERTKLTPHAEQALDETALSLAMLGWQEQQSDAIISLRNADYHLGQLHRLLTDSLREDAPGFDDLVRLLALFRWGDVSTARVTQATEPTETTPDSTADALPDISQTEPEAEPLAVALTAANVAGSAPGVPALPLRGIQDRSDALMRLREIQQWFLRYEPSSPVGDMLAITEQMVGKRFAELLQILPQELIVRLSQGQES